MVSCCYLVNFGCFMYLLYLFGTNLLIQCQVPVPVFSVFLALLRYDFGTESKRNTIPEMIFSRTEEDQGPVGQARRLQGAHKPPLRHQGEAAVGRLVTSLSAP